MKNDTAKGMGEKEMRQEQAQMESKMNMMNGAAGNPGVDLSRPGDKTGVNTHIEIDTNKMVEAFAKAVGK